MKLYRILLFLVLFILPSTVMANNCSQAGFDLMYSWQKSADYVNRNFDYRTYWSYVQQTRPMMNDYRETIRKYSYAQNQDHVCQQIYQAGNDYIQTMMYTIVNRGW